MSTKPTQMILIYYDGSSGSTAAVDLVAQLWAGQAATILAVWEPAGPVADPEAPGHDAELHDAKAKRDANDLAKAGVERATKAGLNVTSRAFAKDRSIAETIVLAAEDVGANLIVLGTSRLIGRDGAILGSVAHTLVRDADLPVLVVPSRELAAKRSQRWHHLAGNLGYVDNAASPG